MSLGTFLSKNRFSQAFISRYIIPMGAAIWSTPDGQMLEFPAQTFARFFENHGLLSVTDHPQWYSIKGGSHEYVKAFLKGFTGKVFTNSPVRRIVREDSGIRIMTDAGESSYDAVVMASHADETLAMLADPSPAETRLLSPWRYTENQTVLHTDPGYLPPLARARSSWNYLKGETSGAVMSMTYYMNMLHDLKSKNDYCVTLNPRIQIPDHRKIAEFLYTHPQFSTDAVATQQDLDRLSGERSTYSAGPVSGMVFMKMRCCRRSGWRKKSGYPYDAPI